MRLYLLLHQACAKDTKIKILSGARAYCCDFLTIFPRPNGRKSHSDVVFFFNLNCLQTRLIGAPILPLNRPDSRYISIPFEVLLLAYEDAF